MTLEQKIIKLYINLRHRFYIKYNRYKFKLHYIKFGKNLNVFYRIHLKIHPLSKITIGDNFTFTSGDSINPLCRNIEGCIYTQNEQSSIKIGNNVGISSACLWAKKSITIGNNVLIGGDCIIMDTDAHNLNYKIRGAHKRNNKGELIDTLTAAESPIVIEDDVLIGARTIILKGVTIGARSVIGAGSVVTKSLPTDCIAAGNPCTVIRNLK